MSSSSSPNNRAMPRQNSLLNYPPHDHTHPFFKCLVIIASIILAIVIIAAIVVCIVYENLKPKVPKLNITSVKLDVIHYDHSSLLLTLEVSLVMTVDNANLKAPASVYDTSFGLNFGGHKIAKWGIEPFEINANSFVVVNYISQTTPIHLNPGEGESLDWSMELNMIRVDLEGYAKTRWRLGQFGPIKFSLRLNCELFLPVDASTIFPNCSSRAALGL